MPPTKAKQLTLFPCHWCGKPLPAGRRDMKFHDVNCRMAYKRWKDKMQRASSDAKHAIEAITSYLDNPDTEKLARKRLIALKRYIEGVCEWAVKDV